MSGNLSLKGLLDILYITCSDCVKYTSKSRATCLKFYSALQTEIKDPAVLNRLTNAFQPVTDLFTAISMNVQSLFKLVSRVYKLVGIQPPIYNDSTTSDGDGATSQDGNGPVKFIRATSQDGNGPVGFIRAHLLEILSQNSEIGEYGMGIIVSVTGVESLIGNSSLDKEEKQLALAQLHELEVVVAQQAEIISAQHSVITATLAELQSGSD